MKNILVYHVGSLGDTVIALPAFRLLRSSRRDCAMDLVNLSVRESLAHAALYEHTGIFRRTAFLSPPRNIKQKIALYCRFLWFCLFHRYGELYLFSPEMPKSLCFFFRLLQRGPIRHCFLLPGMGDMPLYRAYLACLKSAGIRGGADCSAFPETESEHAAAARLASELQTGESLPLIAFGIGGQQVCRWPVERYAELIQKLRAKEAFLPIYLGGEAETSAAAYLRARCGGVFLFDTPCGPLRKTLAFLRHCRAYIGNDTGALHLAAAAGLPCAVIASAHNLPPQKWLPFGERNLIFRSDPECAGCEQRSCPRGDPAPCLAALSVDDVLAQIVPWLADSHDRPEI